MDLLTIYLILTIPAVGVFITVVAAMVFFVSGFLIVNSAIELDSRYTDDDRKERYRKMQKKAFKLLPIAGVILFVGIIVCVTLTLCVMAYHAFDWWLRGR